MEVFLPKSLSGNQNFSQRRDRHGNPFGERISQNPSWVRPLRNKITPRVTSQDQRTEARNGTANVYPNRPLHIGPASYRAEWRRKAPYQRSNAYLSDKEHHQQARNDSHSSTNNRDDRRINDTTVSRTPEQPFRGSPPYTRNRSSHGDRYREGNQIQSRRLASPLREHQNTHTANQETNVQQPEGHSSTPRVALLPPRPPLERNLNVSDFNSPIPTRNAEEVMEELREVTYRYTNHPDPKEREARMQRVLDSEAQGLMEETAARIVANETAAALVSHAQQLICFHPEPGFENTTGREITFSQAEEAEPSNQTIPARGGPRPTRPPKPKRVLQGSRGPIGPSLRQHNLARVQRSPATPTPNINIQAATPTQSSRRRGNRPPKNSHDQGRTPRTPKALHQQGTQEQRVTQQDNEGLLQAEQATSHNA